VGEELGHVEPNAACADDSDAFAHGLGAGEHIDV